MSIKQATDNKLYSVEIRATEVLHSDFTCALISVGCRYILQFQSQIQDRSKPNSKTMH